MTYPLQVLILEDCIDDADLMLYELHKAGFEPDWQRVDTEAAYLTHLENIPDIILADYNMPQFDALRALYLLQERELDIPFIIVTGSISEEVAVACMKNGAADYLLKDRLARLGPAVIQALEQKKHRCEHEQAQAQLHKLSLAVNHSPVAVIIYDIEGIIEYINPKFTQVTGYTNSEIIGKRVFSLGDNPAKANQQIWDTITAGHEWHGELLNRKKDGENYWVSISISPITTAAGEITHFVEIQEDITERKITEEQIRQQDRLAAVGQLASGIAHDFNNVMAVIILYSQMLFDSSNLTEKERQRLQTIYKQANRAADLTTQILDFSRQSVMKYQPINLRSLVKEWTKLLERTLQENIKIELFFDEDNHVVNADATRLQQVMMNLALNARDAMPEGGTLQIDLSAIAFRSNQRPPIRAMSPGEWVRIRVADTGAGIHPKNLPRIFEPFFTTKAPDQGTGLGLAQVYGIVTQHNGFIDVVSQVSQGTTFTIYLPALSLPVEVNGSYSKKVLATGKQETVLVVEDSIAAREAVSELLQRLNYRVHTADNGADALKLFERHADEVDLVLSDMIMPIMGGVDLFQCLRERQPHIKMVLVTGYPLEDEGKALLEQGIIGWVQKPFKAEQIAKVVQEALASNGS